WVSHELIENAIANRLKIYFSVRQAEKKEFFLWRIVTGDEKWIYFKN
ncbi:hypothetical protein EAG_10550, partial [Camponotus floridanus]